LVQSRLKAGETVRVDEYEIRLLARISSVGNNYFSFIWGRPEAIEVRQSDGSIEVMRIEDQTRRLLIVTMILLACTAWLLMRMSR
jgi:hypothetical protein